MKTLSMARACWTMPDPVARWQEFRVRQDKYIAWLKGKQRIHVKGPNCDLVVGITDRIFINSCGQRNFPDGEIFTGPEETITEGWVKFTYPAVYQQREVLGVQLEFKQGRVVKAEGRTRRGLPAERAGHGCRFAHAGRVCHRHE